MLQSEKQPLENLTLLACGSEINKLKKTKSYIFEIFYLVMYLPLKRKGLYHILHVSNFLIVLTSNIDIDVMYLM